MVGLDALPRAPGRWTFDRVGMARALLDPLLVSPRASAQRRSLRAAALTFVVSVPIARAGLRRGTATLDDDRGGQEGKTEEPTDLEVGGLFEE
jgi:hypothetical protein